MALKTRPNRNEIASHFKRISTGQVGAEPELFEIGPHWGKRHADLMGRAGAFERTIWLVRIRGSRFGRCTGHARVFLLCFPCGLARGGGVGAFWARPRRKNEENSG